MITDKIRSVLEQGVQDVGLSAANSQIDQLLEYMRLIQKWNAKFNLVGTSDVRQLLHKHLLDSLAIADYVIRSPVLDVGSGAGLPGIPLAITLPDISFTLIDSNGKKARFMRQAVIELKLENVQVVHGNVTDYQPSNEPQIVLARAFRQIDDVLQVLLNVCSQGGQMMVMLGKRPKEIPLVDGISRCVTQKIKTSGSDDIERHLLVATKT